MSDDRSSGDLLQQPRIDRDERDDGESRRRWPWIVGIGVVAVAAGATAVALREHAVTVTTSTAVVAAPGNDSAVLQATGYVVARRQATVSAQIIGTLAQVSVEEGQHVTKGQILARLDPTEYQAQLNAAQAQYASAQAQVVRARATLQQDELNATRMDDMVKHGFVS